MYANFQSLLGIQCRDFIILAADNTLSLNNLMITTDDYAKIHKICKSVFIGAIGDASDCKYLTEYIKHNVQLYEKRNSYELKVTEVSAMTRNYLANRLRSEPFFSVNLLIGGLDQNNVLQMYRIDGFGSSVKVPYAAAGVGDIMSLSVMDRHYRSETPENEGKEIIKMCIKSMNERLLIKHHFDTVLIRKSDLCK